MEHGICDSKITDCNTVKFPACIDSSLPLDSEFLNKLVVFLLGRQAEFSLYQSGKILFIYPSTYTSLLFIVLSITLKATKKSLTCLPEEIT